MKTQLPITVDNIRRIHNERRKEISARLSEFRQIHRSGTEERFWEEMVFCFFTGGCSAAMGLRSIEAVRPLLASGTQEEIAAALSGVHRYPNARARYVVESREFLTANHKMKIRKTLMDFDCGLERRDWLAKTRGIKGLGYKEASHFLRNVGFTGYAILDKHVLNCLAELKLIDDPKPPATRSRYIAVENIVRELAAESEVGFDELDLVLWSMKTNAILK
ncbi:MAG: N-glycosylase/DNA lyase [Acidobacteriota bacterium]|nr:MAG: N-glycosylase/DNA lyase [Acidobacteriota bacterium]